MNKTITQILQILKQFDYSKMFSSFNTIVVHLESNKNNNRYKIYRQDKYKKILPIHKSLKINSEHEIDVKKIFEKSLRDFVLKFANILNEKLSNVDLSYLYNNLKNIQINTKGLKLYNFIFSRKARGIYSISKNRIFINNDDKLDSLCHELLHMSSSVLDKENNVFLSGFSQHSKKKNYSIGVGINEGYTQLLAKRYFDGIYQIYDTYVFEVGIAELLEKIIGKEEMESLYFKADLFGLVEQLKKYMGFNYIMTFIDEMDFLCANIDKNSMSTGKMKKTEKSLSYVHIFLLQCYCNKLRDKFKNNQISYEALKACIKDIIPDLYYEYRGFTSASYIAIQMTIENSLRDLTLEEDKKTIK